MVDPGTALGIVSLGLEVCKAFLVYVKDWRGRRKDIKLACEKVDSLSRTLEHIESALASSELNKDNSQRAMECLESSKTGIKELNDRFEDLKIDCEPTPTGNAMMRPFHKAVYPLRKEGLESLGRTVDDLQRQLILALHALEITIGIDTKNMIRTIVESNKDLLKHSTDFDTMISELLANTHLTNTKLHDVHQKMDIVQTTQQEETRHRVGFIDPTLSETLASTQLTNTQLQDLDQKIDHIEANQHIHIEMTQQKKSRHRVANWLSPPHPESNHFEARQKCHLETGLWLLDSLPYQAWRNCERSHLFIYGKAGSGKTILCSTVIEDLGLLCAADDRVESAMFYLSFSDLGKQSYQSLLRSLAAQLCLKGPGFTMLMAEHEQYPTKDPLPDVLEGAIIASIEEHSRVFLCIDALDESPDDRHDTRYVMLSGLERLAKLTTKLKMFVTSRKSPSILGMADRILADTISMEDSPIDEDIGKYISTQLHDDTAFCGLDNEIKSMIRDALVEKADRMFRWVYCQLQQIKKAKIRTKKGIGKLFKNLPDTLDETYERILASISSHDRAYAHNALRWLAFAQQPLHSEELVEACAIDPHGTLPVDCDDKCDIQSLLDALLGLADIEPLHSSDLYGHKVKLAHFSVKEYLISQRIFNTKIAEFGLQPGREHGLLARSCLAYITYYSASNSKTRTYDDLSLFPLIGYASRSWYKHSKSKQDDQYTSELNFLKSEILRDDWTFVHAPDEIFRGFDRMHDPGSGLYYACFLGLKEIVLLFIQEGVDIEAKGGEHGTPLLCATFEGHEDIVKILITAKAHINSSSKRFVSPLQAAARQGNEVLVKLLLEEKADINALGGIYHTALQAAARFGHKTIVELLVSWGADVNTQGGAHGNALCAALRYGSNETAKFLMEEGADVHAQGSDVDSALQLAAHHGDAEIVELLIEKNVDVDACYRMREDDECQIGTPLYAASVEGHEKVVKLLLDAGARVFMPHHCGLINVLYAACIGEQEYVVDILLKRNVDVNLHGGIINESLGYRQFDFLEEEYHDHNSVTPLYGASLRGFDGIVDKLLATKRTNVDALGGCFRTALQAAAAFGHEKVVVSLLAAGADVNARGGYYGTALQAARDEGSEKIVELLLQNGADVDIEGGHFGDPVTAVVEDFEADMLALMKSLGELVQKMMDQIVNDGATFSSEYYEERLSMLIIDRVRCRYVMQWLQQKDRALSTGQQAIIEIHRHSMDGATKTQDKFKELVKLLRERERSNP